MRLAIVVAGFGAEAQAQGLFKFIDPLEQDAQTRTPLNTVAAYSNAGSVFGYQIGPSLHGLADFIPGRRTGGVFNAIAEMIAGKFNPGPDMVLQRQSFPVALFIGLNRNDLRLKVARTETGRFFFVEPLLQFQQTTRWIPMAKSKADNSWGRRPRIHEHERVKWAWDLANARVVARDLVVKEGPDYVQFEEYVNARADTLRSQALLATSWQTLPLELLAKRFYEEALRVPQPSGRVPGVVRLEVAASKDNKPLTTSVAVIGDNLDMVTNVDIVPANQGIELVSYKVSRGSVVTGIKIQLPKLRTEQLFQFRLDYKLATESQIVLSPPFRIRPAPRPPKPPTSQPQKPPKELSVTRELELDSAGRVTKEVVTIPVGMRVELVRELLSRGAKQNTAGDVSVTVSTEAKAGKTGGGNK